MYPTLNPRDVLLRRDCISLIKPVNHSSTAVPFWGKTTRYHGMYLEFEGLSPKREGSREVKWLGIVKSANKYWLTRDLLFYCRPDTTFSYCMS